jgi:hypothetical protein
MCAHASNSQAVVSDRSLRTKWVNVRSNGFGSIDTPRCYRVDARWTAVLGSLVDDARICARAQATVERSMVVLKDNIDNMAIYI